MGKQKHKGPAGPKITPPYVPEGTLAGEPGTPGEYDPAGSLPTYEGTEPVVADDDQGDAPAAELPPLGTPAETDTPQVDAETVAALTSLEPEQVTGGPLGSPETPGTNDATAGHGDDAGTGASDQGGKGGRYDTPEKKAERNRKERERQARKRAQAAQAAGKVNQVTQATNVARKALAPVKEPQAAVQAQAPGVDLDTMLGLSFHAIALAVPERFGGGTLTAEERAMLGKAWAAPLAPYLSGAAGPWAVAAISTVQVFAIRAMSYQPPAVDARPSQGHVREVEPPAPPQGAVREPALDGIAAAPAARVTQQEPGVGGAD